MLPRYTAGMLTVHSWNVVLIHIRDVAEIQHNVGAQIHRRDDTLTHSRNVVLMHMRDATEIFTVGKLPLLTQRILF